MLGTYAATILICASSLVLGQAAIALCGLRRWSWLSPGVGLALLCAVCWATVRLPGDGIGSAIAVALATVAAVLVLRGRLEGRPDDIGVGLLVGIAALLAASLPFIVEGHFGILGTGFNPDMSQHLLAADRLSGGEGGELLSQGYPLGPHSIVVALDRGLGIGLVQGFDGLTVAVAVLACLAALTAFAELPRPQRAAGALVVGLAYMVASYLAQGSFKETMQALFVLAFVLALREAGRSSAWRAAPLRFVPAALLAVGSVYVYSYAGLVWLAPIALLWVALRRASTGVVEGAGAEDSLARSAPAPSTSGPAVVRPALLGLLVFAVLVAPELGRMIEFRGFETFDPSGPGLGNLFGQVSPFEALGIWPSGDFRLSPGDGAVPALGFYLGAAFASILLVYGLVLCVQRRETAILSGLASVAVVYGLARIGGTPYTAAKAIEVAAPVAALAILLPLLRRPVGLLYLFAAAGCMLLALANAPVGPRDYSPALTGLRPIVADGSTLVLASERLLDDEHGERYLVWELRGGRVCVEPTSRARAGERPPAGVRYVVAEAGRRPPFAGLHLRRAADPYLLWETRGLPGSRGGCPLIAVRQARQGPPPNDVDAFPPGMRAQLRPGRCAGSSGEGRQGSEETVPGR